MNISQIKPLLERYFLRSRLQVRLHASTINSANCLCIFIVFSTQIKSIKLETIQYINNLYPMANNSKRGWLPEQDQLLLQLVAEAGSEKFKWVEVAKILHEKMGRLRTGKQCRQRWQHQLNPAIVRDEWTDAQQMKLFQLQSEYGNKWAQIAQFLPGRTDNAVKNFFYSAVRRVFTKVNIYLNKQRNLKEFKSIRDFQTDFLSKLMAVVDGNFTKKIRLTTEDAIHTAKKVLANVAVLSISHDEKQDQSQNDSKLAEMVKIMHEFRKCCKKRKQRKSQLGGSEFEESSQEPSSCKSHNQLFSTSENSNKIEKSSKKYKSAEISPKSQMKDQQEQKDFELLKQMKVLSSRMISGEEMNTTKSIEFTETNQIFNTSEPALFRIFSGVDDRRTDKWWQVLNVNSGANNSFRMQEEMGNWEWKEDAFSLGNQRQDLLGSSQFFGSNQVVTKFKMLEASIALEDLLLNSKKSSRFEQYPQIL